jgi:hypothetical protein
MWSCDSCSVYFWHDSDLCSVASYIALLAVQHFGATATGSNASLSLTERPFSVLVSASCACRATSWKNTGTFVVNSDINHANLENLKFPSVVTREDKPTFTLAFEPFTLSFLESDSFTFSFTFLFTG